MRELNFKVWDEEEKKFLERNSYLLYFDNTGDDVFEHETHRQLSDYKIMQYTGLKDKNGVEIYEGDLVRIQCLKVNEDEYIDRKVIYNDGEGMYVAGGYILGRINHRVKVVGNKYEDSEFLEGDNNE